MSPVPSAMSPHAARVCRALIGSLALAASACDAAVQAPNPGQEPAINSVEIALQQGPTIAFDVGVDLVYCAATVRCEPALLVDPFSGDRTTTLVLAYTCRAGGPSATPVPLDVFQAIGRRMTCFDEGDPADPSSWQPPAGNPVVPLREEVFAGLVNAWGDTQYNLAVLPLDALSHAFCRVEAWGVFDSAPAGEGDRSVRHNQGAPVAYWEVFIDGATTGSLDCHLGSDDVSSLRYGSAVSVSHTLPTPLTAGQYPRRQSFAIVLGALIHMQVGAVTESVRGLRVAYGLDAEFPAASLAKAGDLETRDLWLADPDDGQPIDIAASRSCSTELAGGELDAIAIEVVDWWTRGAIGAVVLHDTLGDERFACEHNPGSSSCRLIAPADIPLLAPCLTAP